MTKKNVSKAEAARRAAQSRKDKKASSSVPKSITMGPKQPRKKVNVSSGAAAAYAKLVLDPCNAQFAQSNMPGNSGAQQVRLPFRRICTTPTATTGITGSAITGGTPCNSLEAVIAPHAMTAVGGPATLCFRAQPNETLQFATAGQVNGPYYDYADPAGLGALTSFVGEMRPIAACIRITCLGSDSQNQGLFFGYEGAAKQFVTHADGDFTKTFTPLGSIQDVIFNGQTTGDTYKTYEVRINYPNAPPQWQDWRALGTATSVTGVVESGDANDISFSEMPIGIVGVTSAQPGVSYLFDGAIVYEWQPKTIAGLVGPKKVPADPTMLSRVAKAVQGVANSLGGMLISTATDFATGGNASAALGLLRQGYAAYANSRANQPLLLGWR